MRFAVCIVSPLDYPHSAAFAEVAETVHYTLLALGHDSILSSRLDNRRRRHIVFGANVLPRYPMQLPHDAVLINLEQVSDDSVWMKASYIDILRQHTVWDYSESNIAALAKRGVRASLLPIGYVPQLTRIERNGIADIDVLFYGVFSERRRDLLLALENTGVALHVAFNVYGPARDALIARSNLVLNLHHYPAHLFEAVRVSYLLANHVCVVSERGRDAALEAPYEDAVHFTEYGGLIDACHRLLADPAERAQQAARGFAYISSCDLQAVLARRLNELAD